MGKRKRKKKASSKTSLAGKHKSNIKSFLLYKIGKLNLKATDISRCYIASIDPPNDGVSLPVLNIAMKSGKVHRLRECSLHKNIHYVEAEINELIINNPYEFSDL